MKPKIFHQVFHQRYLVPAAVVVLLAAFSPRASAQKLDEDDRVELLRGLMSEYATVKAYLPRSKKPLPYNAEGNYDQKLWEQIGRELGPAARVGDLVQITHVDIDHERLVLEINNGMKGPKGAWKNHVQIGVGPTMSPINQQQNSNAPSGTSIAVLFGQPVPPGVKSDEIKKILASVLDFNQGSATDNYLEKLPEPIQNAIKAHKVIVGMDRDMVMLAVGRPRHKERNVLNDGSETEDWIYGEPPGKITFVVFTGPKVTRVKESYADIGGSTAPPLVAQ
jgi:hypothetical protein